MRSRLFVLILLLFCSWLSCWAAEVQVVITDPQGKALKNALVILQEVGPPEHELFRALTNDAGMIAPHDLTPGVYRAIAVYPYSRWQTGIQEFLVANTPVKVAVEMEEMQALDSFTVSIGQLTVHVLDANGKPVAGARVLIRDAEAHASSEHWGTTTAQGTTTLDLTGEPSRLIVVSRDKLYSFPVNSFDTERTVRLGKPPG